MIIQKKLYQNISFWYTLHINNISQEFVNLVLYYLKETAAKKTLPPVSIQIVFKKS